jgi:long-chain acyl-CoA synthetase
VLVSLAIFDLLSFSTFNKECAMRTGDLGTIDKEGNIFLRGRCKTMILGPSGQNIYPEEIESLLNAQPAIDEALGQTF